MRKKNVSGKPEIEEKALRNWSLVCEFNRRLSEKKTEELVPKSEEDKRRLLHQSEYLSLLLFQMWNPVIRSMRALCAATHLPRVQQELCGSPVSLGSFSEMQTLIDPALLERVFESAVKDLQGRAPQIADPQMAQVAQMCHHAAAIDSTLLEALNRMLWAEWNNQHQAVRLHVKLSIWSELPLEAKVTDGKHSERAVLKEVAKPGDFLIGDRYYGANYHLLQAFSERGIHFVFRLRNDSILQQESPIALRPEDETSGVLPSAGPIWEGKTMGRGCALSASAPQAKKCAWSPTCLKKSGRQSGWPCFTGAAGPLSSFSAGLNAC